MLAFVVYWRAARLPVPMVGHVSPLCLTISMLINHYARTINTNTCLDGLVADIISKLFLIHSLSSKHEWSRCPLHIQEELDVEGYVLRQGRNVIVVSLEFKTKKPRKLTYVGHFTFYSMASAKLWISLAISKITCLHQKKKKAGNLSRPIEVPYSLSRIVFSIVISKTYQSVCPLIWHGIRHLYSLYSESTCRIMKEGRKPQATSCWLIMVSCSFFFLFFCLTHSIYIYFLWLGIQKISEQKWPYQVSFILCHIMFFHLY